MYCVVFFKRRWFPSTINNSICVKNSVFVWALRKSDSIPFLHLVVYQVSLSETTHLAAPSWSLSFSLAGILENARFFPQYTNEHTQRWKVVHRNHMNVWTNHSVIIIIKDILLCSRVFTLCLPHYCFDSLARCRLSFNTGCVSILKLLCCVSLTLS